MSSDHPGRGASQDRSRRRRDALLRAAIDLLDEGGAKAITHRAVSRRAGLPAASAGYYFPTIQELIDAALRAHVEGRAATLAGVLDRALDGGGSWLDVAERMARALVAGESGVTVAQYEVYLEAARNPALRGSVEESSAAFAAVVADLLGSLGVRDPKVAARALVTMADGCALHRLAAPRDQEEDVQLLFTSIQAIFLYHVLDADQLDDLRAPFTLSRP